MRKPKTPTVSLPAEGLMLWEVIYQAHYYDNDPRMPGNVTEDERFFVLAKSQRGALKKAEPLLKKCKRRDHKGVKVVANVVALENLTQPVIAETMVVWVGIAIRIFQVLNFLSRKTSNSFVWVFV